MLTHVHALSLFTRSLLEMLQGGAVLAYAGCQLGLAVYASHRWRMFAVRGPRSVPAPPAEWPLVTVQLPVFNEPEVVERLLEAAGALDYAYDRLGIQLLDDSTDDTPERAAPVIARLRARGIRIEHLRRGDRHGFKAGALAVGLARTDAEFVAVFDADFVPAPDFLRRMLPHFADPHVGMVQARWGHLNREHSLFTAAQAVLLDAHFLLEHAQRMRRGHFFNFNGTAGVWRRTCIDAAGGWSHDTLTEDLDLSYRAQLAGWRFVFAPDVVVPAELPEDMPAFLSQQRRWVKGSIQTARKLLPRVLASRMPWTTRLEAVLHLTANVAYPMLLALGLLLLPVLLGRSVLPPALVWALQVAVLVSGVVPVALFLARGQIEAGRRGPGVWRDVAGALVLGMGLSLNNARAVLEGLGPKVGAFERTPKRGSGAVRSGTKPRPPRLAPNRPRPERLLAVFHAALACWAVGAHEWSAIPFVLLLAVSYAWVGTPVRRPNPA